MIKVNDILQTLWALAPAQYKESWDNIGLLCGHPDAPVTRVLTALDASLDVAQEAAQRGCELVAVHHPLIFRGVMAATDDDLVGRRVLAFAERGIAVICMHTNLDCAPGGVNDLLAARLGLQNIEILQDGETAGLIRIGETAEQPLPDFLTALKTALDCPGLRYSDGGRPVRRVAVGGGACIGFWQKVREAGCDTFVTADLKYHEFCDAVESGLNLIDAGHFETENPVCDVLAATLSARFPSLEVLRTEVHARSCIRYW